MRIYLPVFPETVAASAISVHDIFWMANGHALQLQPGAGGALFDVQLVAFADTLQVQTATVTVPCHIHWQQATDPAAAVVVTALAGDVGAVMAKHPGLGPWLQAQYQAGAWVASNCTGAFLLAGAGLLGRGPATVSWFAAEAFRRAFPQIALREEQILVEGERLLTSGAATAYLPLVIRLLELLGEPALAEVCAKFMLIDKGKAPQSSYALLAAKRQHSDTTVLALQDLLEQAPLPQTSLAALAEAGAMSVRTLLRRFKAATGTTPAEYRQRACIEKAKHALERTERPVKEIVYDLGFEDQAHFREVFKRFTGVTPSKYRALNRFAHLEAGLEGEALMR